MTQERTNRVTQHIVKYKGRYIVLLLALLALGIWRLVIWSKTEDLHTIFNKVVQDQQVEKIVIDYDYHYEKRTYEFGRAEDIQKLLNSFDKIKMIPETRSKFSISSKWPNYMVKIYVGGQERLIIDLSSHDYVSLVHAGPIHRTYKILRSNTVEQFASLVNEESPIYQTPTYK